MSIVAAAVFPHPPLIIPSVGGRQREVIRQTVQSCQQAAAFLAAAAPETVVVLSPHSQFCAQGFHLSPGPGAQGSFAAFGAPEVQLSVLYDEALAGAIRAAAGADEITADETPERDADLDHATLVPLWFLQREGFSPPIVRIGLSGLSPEEHFRFGRCIARAAKGKRVAVLASGDLSHRLKTDGPYGFAPEGPELDRQITEALNTGQFSSLLAIDETLAEKGAECGLRSFQIMAGALDGLSVRPRLLSYEGPFGVGYAVATFQPAGPQ